MVFSVIYSPLCYALLPVSFLRSPQAGVVTALPRRAATEARPNLLSWQFGMLTWPAMRSKLIEHRIFLEKSHLRSVCVK